MIAIGEELRKRIYDHWYGTENLTCVEGQLFKVGMVPNSKEAIELARAHVELPMDDEP